MFRALLRAARAWPDLNMRTYATRRIRDDFRANAGAAASDVPGLIAAGKEQLGVVTRQATIATMYDSGRRRNVLELQREGGATAEELAGGQRPESTHS